MQFYITIKKEEVLLSHAGNTHGQILDVTLKKFIMLYDSDYIKFKNKEEHLVLFYSYKI